MTYQSVIYRGIGRTKMQKLTEEQKEKIISVVDEVLFSEPEEPCDPEYVTEYDVLMKKKEEEFKLHLLKDDDSSNIESLIEFCDAYLEEKKDPENEDFTSKFASKFTLIMMYDMWINECSFWPTNNPKLWKKWDKLKKIKVRKRD
jgi:hypothetical protein